MTRSTLRNIIQEVVRRKLNEQDLATVDSSAGETGLSDADKKKLENLQAQSDKLTANIQQVEGDIAKLKQIIQPKIEKAERTLKNLQTQRANVIGKQQSIQRRA